jgi:hypothetical protein
VWEIVILYSLLRISNMQKKDSDGVTLT